MTEKQEKIVQTAGRDRLGDFAPEFAHYNDDILFGENWNNQDLDLKTRCLLTVTALMAQGITDASLEHHLQNAKNHGVSQAEIVAAITHVAFYAGWPKAWAVFNLAKGIWMEEDQWSRSRHFVYCKQETRLISKSKALDNIDVNIGIFMWMTNKKRIGQATLGGA